MGIDWKTAAISELRDLPLAEQALESLPELIGRQDAIIHRIRTSDPERPVGGNGDGDALLGAIMYRDELRLRLVEVRRVSGAVHRALGVLSDREAYVLEQLLIMRRPVDDLCQEYSVEPNTVYRWERQALERFAKALYGCK